MTPTLPVDIQYQQLIRDILDNGTKQCDRTDVGQSYQRFGAMIRFDTQNRFTPMVQVREFFPKTALAEFTWMMSGSTDSKVLEKQGINIWKGNTTRSFLNHRNLEHLPEGDIGKSYGYQFRGGNVDQISNVIQSLGEDPTSRRHVISIWNPEDIDKAPLAPCSYIYEFMYDNGKLHLYQHLRSSDVIYGLPYNMMFGCLMQRCFADIHGYETGEYLITMTNAHIYENQLDVAHKILGQDVPSSTPKLSFTEPVRSIDDIINLKMESLNIQDWVQGPNLGRPKMAA